MGIGPQEVPLLWPHGPNVELQYDILQMCGVMIPVIIWASRSLYSGAVRACKGLIARLYRYL